MKIIVMGTGGMGGYYGGLLSQKGHEVTFIARGEHLAAIQKNGLQVKSIHGDFTVSPANATEDPAKAGTPDLILFCTKTYSTDEGVQKIKPIVGANTTVLSLQNGIDAAERIGKVVGMEHMIGGATWISSAVTAPGSHQAGIRVPAGRDRRAEREAHAARPGHPRGLQANRHHRRALREHPESPVDEVRFHFGRQQLWLPDPAAHRRIPRRAGDTGADHAACAGSGGAGTGQGVQLDADVAESTMAFIDKNGPAIKPSMQLDVESRPQNRDRIHDRGDRPQGT